MKFQAALTSRQSSAAYTTTQLSLKGGSTVPQHTIFTCTRRPYFTLLTPLNHLGLAAGCLAAAAGAAAVAVCVAGRRKHHQHRCPHQLQYPGPHCGTCCWWGGVRGAEGRDQAKCAVRVGSSFLAVLWMLLLARWSGDTNSRVTAAVAAAATATNLKSSICAMLEGYAAAVVGCNSTEVLHRGNSAGCLGCVMI